MLVLFRALYTSGPDKVGSVKDGALSPGLYSELAESDKTKSMITNAAFISSSSSSTAPRLCRTSSVWFISPPFKYWHAINIRWNF